jgi:NCAIR mutase (PurE)-related protein
MNRDRLAGLLEAVRDGGLSVEEALERLRHLPFEDLGFARVDHHRSLRRGMPEVVYAPGKTDEQLVAITDSMAASGSPVLVSRAGPEQARLLLDRHPGALHDASARMVVIGDLPEPSGGLVVVVTAGTADIPVAEEAALTAAFAGVRVERIFDAGVAGVHRLVPGMELFGRASAIVVVAGMEGALPSVVAGMVACPVIAVPTSVGYGASFHGLAALLAMINSCAGGVAVVNIDAGFSAGYVAALIARGRGRGD